MPLRTLLRLLWVLWVFNGFLRSGAGGLVRETPSSLRLPEQGLMSEWAVEPAFPSLPPVFATAVASPPGRSNTLFCVSKYGPVYAITNLGIPTLSVALDLHDRINTEAESGVLGIAFHPSFATNHWVYLTYCLKEIVDGKTNLFNRLSRFTVDPGDSIRIDPASERPLITQFDEDPTHNGGDLEFGPDGYLYVSLGDEGGANNKFGNAWYLDKDFFSAILRLDVDMRPENLEPNPHPSVHAGTYKVPLDNPFVGLTRYQIGNLLIWPELDPNKVRTEFYAIGFRNPWRMSFDTVRGDLYSNDVGQARREEINLVGRGANHGWHVREGTLDWPFTVPDGGLTDPIFEYEHDGGRAAITGSLYYHGKGYPELDDSYLFADYNGDIGTLRHDAGGWSARWIAHADSAADLGLNPATGEILITDVFDGVLRKLVRKTSAGVRPPGKLSETGAFDSLVTLSPAAGIVPYELNVPFWSDGARKRRWFGLRTPGTTFEFKTNESWGSPVGAVWVKHFDLEMQEGNPASARRLETRFLVRSPEGVYGMTYRWNAEGTEAFLVPAEGAEELLSIQGANGLRSQRWRYPSRTECIVCHNPQAGWVLGFKTEQLNRTIDYGHGLGLESQIAALASSGYLDRTNISNRHRLPVLRPATDETWSVEHRVRSYLAANCVQCHHPKAPNSAKWDARFQTPLAGAGLLDAVPLNKLESGTTRIIASGSLQDSVLYRRVSELVAYHMPPLATYVRDEAAVALLRRWIEDELPVRRTYERWLVQQGLDPASPEARRDADPDGDQLSNEVEYLFDQSPLQPKVGLMLEGVREIGGVRLRFRRLANQVVDLQSTQTPNDSASWKSVAVPENAFFVSDQDTTMELLLPFELSGGFFRIQVLER